MHKLIARLGEQVGVKARPHGIRHSSITVAVQQATAAGLDLDQVRDFSRHASINTVIIYNDRLKNMQGQIAEMTAAAAG